MVCHLLFAKSNIKKEDKGEGRAVAATINGRSFAVTGAKWVILTKLGCKRKQSLLHAQGQQNVPFPHN